MKYLKIGNSLKVTKLFAKSNERLKLNKVSGKGYLSLSDMSVGQLGTTDI